MGIEPENINNTVSENVKTCKAEDDRRTPCLRPLFCNTTTYVRFVYTYREYHCFSYRLKLGSVQSYAAVHT